MTEYLRNIINFIGDFTSVKHRILRRKGIVMYINSECFEGVYRGEIVLC